MDHNEKKDEHFKEAEKSIKEGNHKEAWKHLSGAQMSASRHAQEMSESGNIVGAKAYRKIVTGKVADLSRKMNKTESSVANILKSAKELVSKGQVDEALKLLKSVADNIKGAIVDCPGCGSDAALMKDSTQEAGECVKCGAIWGKKHTQADLLKYINEDEMKEPGDKQKRFKKSEVINMLWEMHRKGDPEINAYDINYFDYTGWLKKSLAKKLGLALPNENQEEELKKDVAKEDQKTKKVKETTFYDKKGNPESVVREWSMLTKSDVLDIMLQMVKNNEEGARVNRHTVAKFEATGEMDEDIAIMIYKKAGKDWFELRKEMKKAREENSLKKKSHDSICKVCKPKKMCKTCSMKKEKGDSDFYDDKKKHGHQRKGALKPVIYKEDNSSDVKKKI